MRRWLTSLVATGMIVAGVAGLSAPAQAKNNNGSGDSVTVNQMPSEILLTIFQDLDNEALINALSVNIAWREIASNPDLWGRRMESLTDKQLDRVGKFSESLQNMVGQEKARRVAARSRLNTFSSCTLCHDKFLLRDLGGGGF